jgi:hypothetical protein
VHVYLIVEITSHTGIAIPLVRRRTSLRDQFRWLERILGATLVFNLIDMILTLLVVTTDIAVEANPVMATFLSRSPVEFSLAKLALVSMGVWVLWQHRHRRLAMLGSLAVFTAYLLTIVYHVQSIRALFAC